jgi:dsDNA-specific endonuclease/ATPase MutS2
MGLSRGRGETGRHDGLRSRCRKACGFKSLRPHQDKNTMDTSEAKIFAAKLRQDLPELDLHKFSPALALDEMENFLYTVYQKKETAVKIVYGIGTGRLKEKVLGALRQNPLVETVVEDTGSCIVLLGD